MTIQIPFATQIPSLVSLQAKVRVGNPHASPEFVDAVAILAQCAYEDFSDWVGGGHDMVEAPLNPAEAFGNPLRLAAMYLNRSLD